MISNEAEADIDPRKIAAIVYDDRVAIDSLITAFASELSATGTRVAGLVQVPPLDGRCGPRTPMRLLDVATGETLEMCSTNTGGEAPSCRLDPERFARASDHLLTLCEGYADLLLISRFGKMEAQGKGFRGAIARAVERRLPVLTAVRRGLLPGWFEFTGDIGTVLDARFWVLQQWWREIGPLRS